MKKKEEKETEAKVQEAAEVKENTEQAQPAAEAKEEPVEAEPRPLTLTEKLTIVQTELKAPKGQYNQFGKYKYRSCEDILEAVKPLLKKVGCKLTLSDDIALIGQRFYVKATASFGDGIEPDYSVTAWAREDDAKKGMDAAQVTGSCSSYARKYALNGLFCIDDTKDPDTQDNTKSGKADTKNEAKKEEAAQPAAPAEDTIKAAIAEIESCKTEDEIRKYWDARKPQLGRNEEYRKEVSKKRREIIAAANGTGE